MPKYFLSLIGIFKNESMVLKEWLDHYIWQGVEHFYLIDNGSTDDYENILNKYSDRVSLYSRPQKYGQRNHYNDIFFNFAKNETYYAAVYDLDEFVFGTKEDTLAEYMKKNQHLDGVYCNWMFFGSYDHYEQPESIRETFVNRKAWFSNDEKGIAKSEKTISLAAHRHDLSSTNIVYDNENLRLNHYAIMSKEYFDKVKKVRGDVATEQADHIRNDDYFKRYDYREAVDTLLKDKVQALST